MANQRNDYTLTDIRPPGPSPATGYRIKATRGDFGDSDEAHYILKPDIEFNRPWIASPQGQGGPAFVWPLGVEGFTYTSNTETGIHHYIGDNDVDVDIVYPDELHIVLNGTFPGRTSVQQFQALRKVILHQQTTPGKILGLPGIENQIIYVAIINHQFNHDATDDSSLVAYTIECIKIGLGGPLSSTAKILPTANPSPGTTKRGKSQKRTSVRGRRSTLRGIAKTVYGDSTPLSIQTLYAKNAQKLTDLGIPAYAAPYTRIPLGTDIEF